MEQTYNKQGYLRAIHDVKGQFKGAEAKQECDSQGRWTGKVYIQDDRSGTILSPVCMGERSAWIFAAIFCHNRYYSDQTVVPEVAA